MSPDSTRCGWPPRGSRRACSANSRARAPHRRPTDRRRYADAARRAPVRGPPACPRESGSTRRRASPTARRAETIAANAAPLRWTDRCARADARSQIPRGRSWRRATRRRAARSPRCPGLGRAGARASLARLAHARGATRCAFARQARTDRRARRAAPCRSPATRGRRDVWSTTCARSRTGVARRGLAMAQWLATQRSPPLGQRQPCARPSYAALPIPRYCRMRSP